ncbi:hypothetical protein OFO98_26065, partial [Escherichia coli]|nr:hypothetical protein [Escherichia coli]
LNKTGPQSIHILRGVRQQQDEPGRFSICSRQAAVVHGLIRAWRQHLRGTIEARAAAAPGLTQT